YLEFVAARLELSTSAEPRFQPCRKLSRPRISNNKFRRDDKALGLPSFSNGQERGHFAALLGQGERAMPRKVLLALAAALLATALPAVASADYSLLDFESATDALQAVDPTIDPPPNDRSNDFAVGGFQGERNNNVGFSAHSGPLGENPQGHLSETVPLFYG